MKKVNKKEVIHKDMTIHEIVQKYPKSIKILMKNGMSCFNCGFALQETLEQGCLAHGIEVDKVLKQINKKINSKK